MVTIQEIAKIAGVAKSTVSRYLNGGSVSLATKQKLEKVIEENNYIPNSFAQSLKARITNLIGVVVPRLDSYSASRTMIGIDEQLRALNLNMIISNSNLSIEREIENIYSLAKQKVAGIILLATEITQTHIEVFKKINVPVLVVGQEHEHIHCLIHNDSKAAYELGKFVVSRNHKRVAFLGVTEKDIAVGIKRKEGLKKAILENSNCIIKCYESSFSSEQSKLTAEKIICDFYPSIIICATDNMALGVMKAAYEKGLSIPNDLSIAAFGGYSLSEHTSPGLTTVKFHYQQAGHIAAKKINDLIKRKKVEMCTTLDFELLIRESVDKI